MCTIVMYIREANVGSCVWDTLFYMTTARCLFWLVPRWQPVLSSFAASSPPLQAIIRTACFGNCAGVFQEVCHAGNQSAEGEG